MQQVTYRVMQLHAYQVEVQVDRVRMVDQVLDIAVAMQPMMHQLDLLLSKSNAADLELGSLDSRELFWSLSLLGRGTLSIVSHPVIAFSPFPYSSIQPCSTETGST